MTADYVEIAAEYAERRLKGEIPPMPGQGVNSKSFRRDLSAASLCGELRKFKLKESDGRGKI